MDRIIEIKVFGNHLTKDSKNAGTRGEANITKLRITFDEGWDGYAKEVIFWDAYGENSVRIYITENLMERKGVYLVPIPAEAMVRAGMLTFTIRGALENKIQASITGKLEVKDSPDILEPIPPTPSELTQLQNQMERITLPWRSGEGEKSVVLKESGKAKSNFSAALGENSVAGVKAFFIEGVDFKNQKIYLTKQETVPSSTDGGNVDTEFETPKYEKGDVFSVVSSGVFPFCGIIESAENNVISWSSIDPYFERRGLDTVKSLFYVPTKPDIGAVIIGENSFNVGKNSVLAGKCTFAGGRGNIIGAAFGAGVGANNKIGFGSFGSGIGNDFPGQWNLGGGNSNKSDLTTRGAIIGGYGNNIKGSGYGLFTGYENIADAAEFSIVSGAKNKLSGKYNILNGYSNDILASCVLALGKRLKAETDHQVILGEYNASNPLAAIIYGNGRSEESRKNAFEILKDGSAKFSRVTDLNGNSYLKTSELDLALDAKRYLKKSELVDSLDAKGYLTGGASFNLKLGSIITITGRYNQARGVTITITGDYNDAVGKSLTIMGESNVLNGKYLSCKGNFNYIEGKSNHTTGDFNFVRGDFLTASGNQIVLGKYNVDDPDKIFIIGGGISAQRKNIFTIDREGNVTFAENQNLGDISAALDSILTIENALIGGDAS